MAEYPSPSPAQIRLEVLRELVQRYNQPEADWVAVQTLRLSHVVEHGTEPTSPTTD